MKNKEYLESSSTQQLQEKLLELGAFSLSKLTQEEQILKKEIGEFLYLNNEYNLTSSKKTDDSFIKAEEGNSDGLKIIDASIPFGSVLILVFKIAISILIVYLIFLPILGLLGFAGLAAFF